MVAQYTTLLHLADVAKRIDDIHYENFHIPVLEHQHRVLHHVENALYEVGHVHSERDYVDARIEYEYSQPEFQLRESIRAVDLQRLQRINELFLLSLRKKSISVGKIRQALTKEQFAEFSARLEEVFESAEALYGNGAPFELKRYNKLLNEADFLWGRFENSKVKPKTGKSFEDRAERKYEIALEYLEETFVSAKRNFSGGDAYAQLNIWMDRLVDFDAGADRTISIESGLMPRVRGSKSVQALDSGLPKLSKRLKHQYCALCSLLVAACEIAFVLPEKQEEQQVDSILLKKKLTDLMKKKAR